MPIFLTVKKKKGPLLSNYKEVKTRQRYRKEVGETYPKIFPKKLFNMDYGVKNNNNSLSTELANKIIVGSDFFGG